MFHQFKNFVSFVMAKFSCWEAVDRRCWYNKEDNEDKSWLQHRQQLNILMRPLMLMRKKMLNKIGSQNWSEGQKPAIIIHSVSTLYWRGFGCHQSASEQAVTSPTVDYKHLQICSAWCNLATINYFLWTVDTGTVIDNILKPPGMEYRLISYAGNGGR